MHLTDEVQTHQDRDEGGEDVSDRLGEDEPVEPEDRIEDEEPAQRSAGLRSDHHCLKSIGEDLCCGLVYDDPGTSVEPHERYELLLQCIQEPVSILQGRFDSQMIDMEDRCLPVSPAVHPCDESAPEEDREREIPEASLRWGDVALEQILEREDLFRPLALDDQVVEG